MNLTIDIRMGQASGIGTYIRQVVPRIMKLKPAWRFRLLGAPPALPPTENFNLPNASVIPCDAPPYSIAEQIQLVSRVPKDTDLFWSPHYNFPVLYPGKLVATVHDVFHLAMPAFTGGPHKRLYARMMFDRLIRKASGIICVSDFTKKELGRFTGVDERRTRVIHQGVNPLEPEAKTGKNPHSKPYFLYVGNIKPHKNLGRLLEAFALIQNQAPHDLILAGKKDGFLTGDPGLLERAKAFRDRVHFTGWVEEKELRNYYLHAEALIFPSLYEGFGLPPLEAMVCGCPVISSWAASLPEVCGGAALYFDPLKPGQMAECLLKVIRDPLFREELLNKGLAKAGEYSWDRCAGETAAWMEQVHGGGNQ